MSAKLQGDPGPAGEAELEGDPSILQRRPAELSTFIAAVVAVAAELSIDLSTTALLAVFIVIGTLPAIVTHYVTLYTGALNR
jgi:hypothetical protein